MGLVDFVNQRYQIEEDGRIVFHFNRDGQRTVAFHGNTYVAFSNGYHSGVGPIGFNPISVVISLYRYDHWARPMDSEVPPVGHGTWRHVQKGEDSIAFQPRDAGDRKSVVTGKGGSVRVDPSGGRSRK